MWGVNGFLAETGNVSREGRQMAAAGWACIQRSRERRVGGGPFLFRFRFRFRVPKEEGGEGSRKARRTVAPLLP